MAFDVSSGSRGVRSSVNITPLIDVVLVLLIIFMVMTPTTMKHLKPQIARESTDPSPVGPQPVTVEMTVAGYKVDGQETEWSQLFERVKGRLAQSRQGAVFLKIDDEVGYGEAVRLFDLCRGAGAQVLALPPGTHG
jgi:biopolymer transport protein ExbD